MLFTEFEKYLDLRRGAIHVGGHEGQERDWYVKQSFTPVLWFEPNVEIYKTLLQNIDSYSNQYSFNLGVHDTLQEATLHVSSNNGESSSLLELGIHAKMYPKVKYVKDMRVKLTRLDTFFKTHLWDINDFNFINIDVQGVELNVLKSMGDLLHKMDYAYIEINEQELYKGNALVGDIDEYLKHFGFIRMATFMTKRHWGDAFYKRY